MASEDGDGASNWQGIMAHSVKSPRKSARSWILYIITPSIFTKGPSASPTPTSYLDGLRGVAAILVYIHHHEIVAHLPYPEQATDKFANAYGYNDQYHFVCLPFIRIIFSGGNFAAAIFFVISGYVLSLKALRLIHSKEFGQLGDTLASAVFRRWTRLFLPVVVTSLGFTTCRHIFGFWMSWPQIAPSWPRELLVWSWVFRNFSALWSHEAGEENKFGYNIYLWSIPVEFRGSVVVYTTLLAISKLRRNMRLWSTLVLVFYFLCIVDTGGEFYAMFLSGLLICEFEILSLEGALPDIIPKIRASVQQRFAFWGIFLAGLYLGGVPTFKSEVAILKNNPGWSYLSLLSPHAVDCKWFYLFFAATFIVLSIQHLPTIKRLLESQVCQYLGRISFGIYLMHGPILWTIGDRLYLAVGWARQDYVDGVVSYINLWPISKAGPLGLELAFLIPNLILLPLTLFVAESITRLCAGPSVVFSQWMYQRSLGSSKDLCIHHG